MEIPALIGWLSSVMLLITIINQIYTQYHKGTAEGVSWFLFTGQIIASIGFTVYSWLLGDTIFIVTNFLLLCSHCVGLWITLRLKNSSVKAGSDSYVRS